jgi:hypothetical protein
MKIILGAIVILIALMYWISSSGVKTVPERIVGPQVSEMSTYVGPTDMKN